MGYCIGDFQIIPQYFENDYILTQEIESAITFLIGSIWRESYDCGFRELVL